MAVAHLTTPEGWEYDITVALPDSPISARSDFSTSPPGESDLILRAVPVVLSFVGTLPGRTAPEPNWSEPFFIWKEPGAPRFAYGGQCRIFDDGEMNIAVNGATVLYCESGAAIAGEPLDQAAIDASAFFNSVERGPEAEVNLWVDYFTEHPTPDYLTIGYGSKGSFCTALIGYDGSVRGLDQHEASSTGIHGTNDGCVWSTVA